MNIIPEGGPGERTYEEKERIYMIIEKSESNEKLKKLIEDELVRYETKMGIVYDFTPFSFFAKENDEIIGAVTGFTCYSEVYIDELVVMEQHRGKNIGTQLINAVEEYYKDYGFNNMNLCTSKFQALKFYEKLGFELEFIRKNKDNTKLDKYFYVKFFRRN